MKKLQILQLLFIFVVPTRILAQSNHYTDYIYEHYLNGKKVVPYKEEDENDLFYKKSIEEQRKLEYYDYLIRTDKQIKENLKVRKILENDKRKSAIKLGKTKDDLDNINNEENKVTNKSKNTKKSVNSGKMYLQLGAGINHLLPYTVSTENLFLNNNIAKNNTFDSSINAILGYSYKNVNTEIEYVSQSFMNNDITGLNTNIMETYIQNFKMSSFGINLLYPLTISKKFKLSFGIGGGIATTYIDDFARAYEKGDKIVDKTVEPSASLTDFKSINEKISISYVSPKISAAVLLNNNITFITSVKYDLFKNFKTEEGLHIKDLSGVNLSFGIKYEFN